MTNTLVCIATIGWKITGNQIIEEWNKLQRWNWAYCTHHYLPDWSRVSFVPVSIGVARNKVCFIKEIMIKHFISTALWISSYNFCLIYSTYKDFKLLMCYELGTLEFLVWAIPCLISMQLNFFWGTHITNPLHFNAFLYEIFFWENGNVSYSTSHILSSQFICIVEKVNVTGFIETVWNRTLEVTR